MTAKEALEIVEKATANDSECEVAIQVIRKEISYWRDECEKLEITLEKSVARMIAAGIF